MAATVAIQIPTVAIACCLPDGRNAIGGSVTGRNRTQRANQKHHINLQSHDLRDSRSPGVAKQCVEHEVTDCSNDCAGEHAATERYQELLAPDELLDLIWSGRD